jgi:hypothetical protein
LAPSRTTRVLPDDIRPHIAFAACILSARPAISNGVFNADPSIAGYGSLTSIGPTRARDTASDAILPERYDFSHCQSQEKESTCKH